MYDELLQGAAESSSQKHMKSQCSFPRAMRFTALAQEAGVRRAAGAREGAAKSCQNPIEPQRVFPGAMQFTALAQEAGVRRAAGAREGAADSLHSELHGTSPPVVQGHAWTPLTALAQEAGV